MAITVSVDTYISLADANTHFDGRLYATEWTAATDAQKEAALKEATVQIDFNEFYGMPYDVVSPQALKFPRSGLPTIDGITYSSSEIPSPIAKACAEMALVMLKKDVTSTTSQDKYKSVKLSSIEAVYRDTPISKDTVIASGYLKGFIVAGSTSQASVVHA